jgi:hypothetical protein
VDLGPIEGESGEGGNALDEGPIGRAYDVDEPQAGWKLQQSAPFGRRRLGATSARLTGVSEYLKSLVGYKEQCLEAGMDAYLSKPLQVKDLFAAIESFCPNPQRV